VLTTVGGVVGILAGLGCPWMLVRLRELLQEVFPTATAGLPDIVVEATPVVLPWSVALAFGISVLIGIVFGIYPARRAAYLDPIEALRHE